MNGFLVVLRKELLEGIREWRALATTLLVAPLLGPFLFVGITAFSMHQAIDDVTAAIEIPAIGAERAPNLVAHLRQNLIDVDAEAFADEGAQTARHEALRQAVRSGDVEVGIVVAEDFAEALAQGQAARIWVVADSSSNRARPETNRVREALAAWSATVGGIRLQLRGIHPTVGAPLAVLQDDVSTPSRRAYLLLGIVGYFVLFAVLIGGSQIAVDITAGERERGSLEPLLAMPIMRETLVLAKVLATLVVMTVSLAITVVSFVAAVQFLPLGELGMTANFGFAVAVQVFLLVFPFAALAAALMVAAASLTRSFREAQTYTSIAMIAPTLPVVFAALRPMQDSVPLMLVPALSQHLLLSDVLRAEALDPLHIVTSVASTAAVAAVLVWLTVHRFRSEKLIL